MPKPQKASNFPAHEPIVIDNAYVQNLENRLAKLESKQVEDRKLRERLNGKVDRYMARDRELNWKTHSAVDQLAVRLTEVKNGWDEEKEKCDEDRKRWANAEKKWGLKRGKTTRN